MVSSVTKSSQKFAQQIAQAFGGSDTKSDGTGWQSTKAVQVKNIEAALVQVMEDSKNGAKKDLWGVVEKMKLNNKAKSDLRDQINKKTEEFGPEPTQEQKDEIAALEKDLDSKVDVGDEIRTRTQLVMMNYDQVSKTSSNISKKFDQTAGTQIGNIK